MCARQVANRSLWQSYKRQSIQEAVIRLMCREGLKSVTMERVAQEVGIAKGTVYLHYRDKQELLDAVKESALAPVTAKIDDILRGSDPADRKLRAYALRYLTYFDDHRDLFRILLYEHEVMGARGSRFQTQRYRRLLQETSRVIREGIRGGVFRDVDPHKAAAMFIEANLAVANQRLLTEKPAPVEEDASLVADIFINGLRRKRA